MIVRLYETAGKETECKIAFAAPLMMIEETNHLEERIESTGLGLKTRAQRQAIADHLNQQREQILALSKDLPRLFRSPARNARQDTGRSPASTCRC